LKKLTNFGILQIVAMFPRIELKSAVARHKNFAEDDNRLQKLKVFLTKNNTVA